MAEVEMGEIKVSSDFKCNQDVKTSSMKTVAPWRFKSNCYQSSFETEWPQSETAILFEDEEVHKVNLNSVGSNSCKQVESTRLKTLAPWRFQPHQIRPSVKVSNSIKDLLKEASSFGVKEMLESPTPTPGKCNSTDVHRQQNYREKLRSSARKEPFATPETIGGQMPRVYPSRVRISPNDSFLNCSDSMHVSNFKSVENDKRLSPATGTKRKADDVHMESNTIEKAKKDICTGRSNGLDSQMINDFLNEYRKIYKNLLDKEQSKPPQNRMSRIDLMAYKIFREKHNGLFEDRKFSGTIPQVKVGEVFHLRVELCIVGLHSHHLNSIDVMKQGENSVAISIVANMRFDDDDFDSDLLDYFGSEVIKGEKLDGGNLALKNSMDSETPIRVIYNFTRYQKDYGDSKTKRVSTYIYDGLYFVEKCWRKKTDDSHSLVMFRLRRKTGQHKFCFKKLLNSVSSTSRTGIFIEDISGGSEKIPISAVNFVDDEHPAVFKYVSQMTYPSKYFPSLSSGCECIDGCSDSRKCACTVKNGGQIPFNESGGILEIKPLVYECGPSCKCPPSCLNRVSQHGIKFKLQVFKTKSMGWGVRSPTTIPCGSFVCQYVGELLTDEEADKRATDEYLFSIGNNYYDDHWEGESYSIPSLSKGPSNKDEVGFAIDASKCGNVGRFINHSCTPNLYAQNLLYDHDDTSIPRIMFFATDDIPPLKELTYDYNYKIDSVRDANGNIKRKDCHCGSIECTGRLY